MSPGETATEKEGEGARQECMRLGVRRGSRGAQETRGTGGVGRGSRGDPSVTTDKGPSVTPQEVFPSDPAETTF